MTDHPDNTSAVYHGSKATKQAKHSNCMDWKFRLNYGMLVHSLGSLHFCNTFVLSIVKLTT